MPQEYDPTVWSRYTGDPERPRRRRTQYDPGVWSRYAAPAGAALAEPDPEPQPRRTTLARALGNIREMFRTPERAEAPEREPFGVRSVQRNLVELARRYPVPGMIGVGRGFETTPIEEVPPEERNILQDFVAGFESGRRATLRGVGTTLESLGLERVGQALREGREPLPNLRPRERTGNRFVDVLRETVFDVGSGVATTVPSIVGGVVGTAVGGPVGGAVGALAPAAGITYGGLREELEEEGVDPQTASRAAAVVTPLSSALEAVVPLSIGRRLLGGAGQQAARGVAREIARGALREGVTEAATEAAQTAVERGAVAATTPQEFFSRETLDQILRAARAGGLTGGLLGGAATAVGDIGPRTPAVDAYLAELERLQRKYGDELQGITPREAQGLERLARRVAEEAGLGEEVLEPIRAEERPPREGRFSRFRRRIAEAISPELRREATEDPLTGLANRGADTRATSEALRERAPGTRTVRFRVDLDNFKALNDTMGHAAGDEALRTVASALRSALREGDAVSVARPGGDEFAITLRVAEGADPAAIRDRLEEAVNRALEEAGLARAGDRTVSASIGFAEARPGMSAEELDRLADQAAIARKRERGVSRPREEAAPAPAGSSVVPGVRMDEEASASADMDAVVEEATEGMEEPATAAEPIDVERVPTVEPERARPQNAGDVGLFPISEIRVDPKRFQFKAATDPETGAGAELKSVRKFDPVLAGVIQVWRDPADGQVYVVNGHHRLELARRLGEQEILVRFIDARDAGEARLIGAMTNIAEGRGTAIDAAKIFREQRITPEELERRGISLRGAIARDGMALANLPQKLFDDVVARRLSIPRGVIIGGSGLSEEQQLSLAKLLEQRKNITNEEAAELVRFVKSAGETEVETIDLFGPQVLRQSLALEKAELSAYVKKQLAQDRRLFGYVGRGRRAQRIEGEGAGRIDVDRAQAIAQQAAQAEEIYNRLSTSAGPISDALNAAAARLAAGEKADVVKRELYDQVRDAIAAELQALQRRPAALAVRERPLQPGLFGEEPQAELVQGELLAEGPSLESPRLSEAEQGARQIVSLLEGKVRRGAASKAEVERYEAARKLLARSQKISTEEMAAQARRAGRVQPADRDTGDLFAAPPEARQPEPTETERPRIGQRTEPEEAPAAAPATPAADLPIRVSPDDIPYQVAYDAYRWNSLTPERRARQTQEEYVRHIEAVYEDLAPLARTEEQRRVLIDELERYRRGYVERELELLRAESRTASPMVTGPARFPVDRNRKALERVARLTREFIQWRDRAIEAMRRKIERTGQEDIDPIEAARRELAEAEALQEHMKRANAIMRRSSLSDEQKRQAMREAGIPDDLIQEAFTPDPVMGALGFGRYRLENNNARIRRLRQRIEELERRATPTTREIRFDGGRIVENAEADRLQIFFDSVPSQEIRNQLKSRGFRWSPREGAWQRQLTNQARWAASSILGVDIPAQDRPRIGERRPLYLRPPAPPEPAESRTPLLSGWAELKAQALGEGQLPPRIRGFASERLPDAGPIVVGTAKTAPRPSDIQRRIQEGLQIKIGIGRFGAGRFMRSVLGLYQPGPRSIRLARYGDIATLGHELGHDMHSLFFGQVDGHLTDDHFVFQPWRDELERLAVGISDESLAEGWAEFWRRYIDNPDVLPERAPKLLAYVEDRLERDSPALKTLFEQVQRDWRLYREASAQARIRAQISTGEEERNLGIRDRWRRIRTDIIDDIEPIRHVVEKLTGTDRPTDIEEDAATLARLVRGSMGTAEVFLEHGVLDFRTLRKVGKSLREVFEPVLDDLDDFRDYMVARRARELHARDITTGIRPDDADWVVAELEKGERGERFRQAFQDLQEYNRGLLKYLVDTGVMSRETMQKILETNQNYVPFYRVLDDSGQKGNPRFSLGFGHLFSPVKRIKGSGRDIIDPIESLIKNTYLYVHLAARQQVSNALAQLAERHGAARFIERIPAPMVPHRFRLGEIEKQLAQIIGEKPLEELRAEAKKRFEAETAGMQPGEIKEAGLQPYDPADEILMFFRPGDYFGKPNIISVLQDGRRVWYEVDPELYAALEGLRAKSMDALVRLLSVPARTLRAGATLAPEFLIRNPARDQLMAFVQSEYGFKPGIDFVRGLFSLLRKDDHYWRWKAAGGENAALVAMDRKAMRQNVETLLRQGGVRNVLKDPLDVLRAISAAMENATRLGEFRRAVRAEGDTKAGLLRAASASREVTTDFARHGAKTEALRQIAAFWNARVQGYDRLVRALRRDPVGAMARIGAGITLPSIILYAINRDDPEYWELPQWQRDLFWHVKIGDTWLRIPKPFELGIVFGTIPERILEWIDSQDPEGLKESLNDFLRGEVASTIFPGVNAVLPLIENLTNYSFFFRRPIVPRSMQDVEPRFQATERTSEIAKLLGRWTNISPLKIDNLLFGWTGGLGRLASQTVDVAVDLATDPGRTTEELLAAGPEDIPAVRGVVSRAPGFSSESVERFYRRLQEARSVRATVNHLEREERFDEIETYLADPRRQELLAQLRHLERVADRLAQLRAQAAIIERDPSMPAAQKKREIEELGREAMEFAREAIERRTPADAATR